MCRTPLNISLNIVNWRKATMRKGTLVFIHGSRELKLNSMDFRRHICVILFRYLEKSLYILFESDALIYTHVY